MTTPTPAPTIPEQIRAARLAARLTQTELAQRIGKSRAMVARWESDDGAYTPDIDTCCRIADACGVTFMFGFGAPLPKRRRK